MKNFRTFKDNTMIPHISVTEEGVMGTGLMPPDYFFWLLSLAVSSCGEAHYLPETEQVGSALYFFTQSRTTKQSVLLHQNTLF